MICASASAASVTGAWTCTSRCSSTSLRAPAATQEPPRVRAMLGALGEFAGADEQYVRELRESLNPLSRFDFGVLATLPNARSWQAK
jgi:hypothetical protein